MIQYDERKDDFEDISSNKFEIGYITQPALYSNGNIWIPDDARLLIFNIRNKTTSWIKADDPKYDLMVQSTNCVYEDRSGNIWVGTSGYGLLKYNVLANKFHHTDNMSINWMHEDNNGNILIVKRGDAVWIFNKRTQSYIKKIPDSTAMVKAKYFTNSIEAVLQDKDGSYWIAKKILLRYDDAIKKFEGHSLNKGFSFPLYDDGDG